MDEEKSTADVCWIMVSLGLIGLGVAIVTLLKPIGVGVFFLIAGSVMVIVAVIKKKRKYIPPGPPGL